MIIPMCFKHRVKKIPDSRIYHMGGRLKTIPWKGGNLPIYLQLLNIHKVKQVVSECALEPQVTGGG